MLLSSVVVVVLILLANVNGAKETVELRSLPFIHNHSSRTTGQLNVGWLGTGYHILRGNPWNYENGLDPGWKLPLIAYTYNQSLTSTDNKWRYPDGTALQSINDCTYQATAQQTFGVQTYYSKLSTYASVSGGGATGSFSLSVGYQNSKSTYSSQQSVAVSIAATCNAYRASLYPFSTNQYQLVQQFANAVAALPTSYSQGNFQTFKSFFDTWGTHISVQTYMGARTQIDSLFTKTKFDEMLTSNVDINAAAKLSWGIYSGSASGSASSATQASTYYEQSRYDVDKGYHGAPAPLNGDIAAWSASVIDNPYALAYTLQPIHSLLQYTGYASTAAALSTALDNLCSNTPGCKPISSENPDPVHAPTEFTCRICSSCGGNYPVQAGRKLNQGDYGTWNTLGDQCNTGYYSENWSEAALCCSGQTSAPETAMCRYCSSCGGSWPADGGQRINQGDWGPYVQYGDYCQGGYNGGWAPPHLCCKVQTQCRMCDYQCGNAFPKEIGRVGHNGDWGAWNTFSGGCGDNRVNTWSPVYCCSK